MLLGEVLGALVFATWGVVSCSSSRLPVWKRRLLAAVAFGALPLPGLWASSESAWAQVAETLRGGGAPAPRAAPRPPRRAAPAPRRRPPSGSAAPAPPPAAPAAVPAVTTPSPFQFVAPTPITGLGIDRS